MNYGVHALMYTYYALRALRLRLPKQIAMVVTVLQISQMIMGITIGVVVYRMKVGSPQNYSLKRPLRPIRTLCSRLVSRASKHGKISGSASPSTSRTSFYSVISSITPI